MISGERESVSTIRAILDAHAGLSKPVRRVRRADNLFSLGMTGLAAVDVMLAVEAAFGVAFPSPMLCKSNVASIDAILSSLRKLQARPLAA